MEGLSLLDEEDGGIVFDPEKGHESKADLNLCLVGMFLMDRSLRVKAMKERMKEVWRPTRGVDIKEVEDGILVFQFYHKFDMMRVCEGGL